MNLKDNLEIFIITYNREKLLTRTFGYLLSENSPVKNVDIRIIDNCSTDGTETLVRQYMKKYTNISYTKNNRNIGFSGNACRAFEYANKKYFWILSDDDIYDFSAWDEVEKAMLEDVDLIVVSRMYIGETMINKNATVLNELTFIPAAIYKTAFITPDVMVYAVLDAATVAPQIALAASVINHNGKITMTSKVIVENYRDPEFNLEKHTHDRVPLQGNSLKHEFENPWNFYCGLALAFDSVKDVQVRHDALLNFSDPERLNGKGPFFTAKGLWTLYLTKQTSLDLIYRFYTRCPESLQAEIGKYFAPFFKASLKRISPLKIITKELQWTTLYYQLSFGKRRKKLLKKINMLKNALASYQAVALSQDKAK